MSLKRSVAVAALLALLPCVAPAHVCPSWDTQQYDCVYPSCSGTVQRTRCEGMNSAKDCSWDDFVTCCDHFIPSGVLGTCGIIITVKDGKETRTQGASCKPTAEDKLFGPQATPDAAEK